MYMYILLHSALSVSKAAVFFLGTRCREYRSLLLTVVKDRITHTRKGRILISYIFSMCQQGAEAEALVKIYGLLFVSEFHKNREI